MDLVTKIEELEEAIEFFNKRILETETEYNYLKGTVQPTFKQLYNGIENYFSVSIHQGVYTDILGGDGRSSPWSDNKNGIIAKIKINNGVYLSDEQIKIVKDYVKRVHVCDHVDLCIR